MKLFRIVVPLVWIVASAAVFGAPMRAEPVQRLELPPVQQGEDVAKRVVARIGSKDILYSQSYELFDMLSEHFINKYAADNRIVVTPEEIRWFDQQYNRFMISQGGTAQPISEESAFVARFFLRRWKINQSVYQRFGGRVVSTDVGPEPMDAHRDLLRFYEKQGEFVIFAPDIAEHMWARFDNPFHGIMAHTSKEGRRLFLSPIPQMPWPPAD